MAEASNKNISLKLSALLQLNQDYNFNYNLLYRALEYPIISVIESLILDSSHGTVSVIVKHQLFHNSEDTEQELQRQVEAEIDFTEYITDQFPEYSTVTVKSKYEYKAMVEKSDLIPGDERLELEDLSQQQEIVMSKL